MIKIIFKQHVDLILIAVMIFSLVSGIINEDYFVAAGGLLLGIGNAIFNLIMKSMLIKSGKI